MSEAATDTSIDFDLRVRIGARLAHPFKSFRAPSASHKASEAAYARSKSNGVDKCSIKPMKELQFAPVFRLLYRARYYDWGLLQKMRARVWAKWLGRKITWRLQRRILPNLRWNQEIWGETIKHHLSHPVRWLGSGCGWRLLGKNLEPLENELVSLARTVVGVDVDLSHLSKHLNISQRLCASLSSLPFSDASFDLITCNMVV
jgi:hypothetical protein